MSKKKKIDTRHLFHAVCHLSLITIRIKPEPTSTLLTQMLFGEVCQITEKKNKQWFKILIANRNIVGWIQSAQTQLITEDDYHRYNENYSLSLDICLPVFNEDVTKPILIGSTLPMYDGISCDMPDGKHVYNGQAAPSSGLEYSAELLSKIALRFLWCPELIGGRSAFGMDAICFVQIIYRFFGIVLPSSANELFKMGEFVDFIEEIKVGDIAFCQDDSGNIVHVGIIMGLKKVIHVNGCVRIDKIDHFGIYNKELHKYTHKLRMVKRILSQA